MSSEAPRRLPPVVKRLGVVSFFNDLASEMVYPLLPAFVTSQLGAGALALGALDGVAEAVAAAVKLAAGWLADRVRWRRPLVLGGYAVAAVVRPLIGLALAAWQVIALRGTDRLGKGIRNPPRDAVIADAAPSALHGRAFGFHRAMDHAGAVLGPLVAWALIAAAGMTPREVILASLLPGVIAVAVVAWALERARPGETAGGAAPAGEAPKHATGVPARTGLFALIVGFAFARFPEALLLLRLQDLGVAVAVVPLLWSALHVVRSLASYPGGQLADRIGTRTTMVLGWVLYGVLCLGLATSVSPAVGSLWFLGFGLMTALTESPERAYVASLSAQRGRKFGLYHATVGVAALPGALLFGGIYAASGGGAALTVSAALAGVLALLAVAPRAGGAERARPV